MSKRFGKKGQEGGGGELMLEIILSTVVFFVVLIVLFAINIPQQELKAVASVISADAALACDMSLVNLLKSDSGNGNYGEFLINSNMKLAGDNTALNSWKDGAKSIFDKTFSDGMWDMSVTNQLDSVVATLGRISDEKLTVFSCKTYVPLPESIARDCWWSETTPAPEEQNFGDGDTATFSTPGGHNVECEIIARDKKIGIVEGASGDVCELMLNADGEEISNTIEDTEDLDEIVLPIDVAGKNYAITITEIDEGGNKVSAKLKRDAKIKECSLTIGLRTTNVSAAA